MMRVGWDSRKKQIIVPLQIPEVVRARAPREEGEAAQAREFFILLFILFRLANTPESRHRDYLLIW